MRKLLSTTSLVAVLALGSAAFAQSSGQGATPGGVAGSGGAVGGGATGAGTQGGPSASGPQAGQTGQAGSAAAPSAGQPGTPATGGIVGQLDGTGKAQPGPQAQTGSGQTGAGTAMPGTGSSTAVDQGAPGRNAQGAPNPGANIGQPPALAQTTGVMTQEQVMSKLATEGFSNVQNVTRDGNNFRARAMQNGRAVDLTVDAYTGTIRSQAASR